MNQNYRPTQITFDELLDLYNSIDGFQGASRCRENLRISGPKWTVARRGGFFVPLQVEAERYDDEWHKPITVLIVDTETGQFVKEDRCSLWNWTEGNGSCDCNRGNDFPHDEAEEDLEDDEEVEEQVEEEGSWCVSERYLVVDAFPLPDDMLGRSLNDGYPEDLLSQYVTDAGWLSWEERNGHKHWTLHPYMEAAE